jgi:hypothetical protein
LSGQAVNPVFESVRAPNEVVEAWGFSGRRRNGRRLRLLFWDLPAGKDSARKQK